jgi:hypothetical protein
MWRAQTLDLKMALLVSNYDHIYASFTLDKYPRPAEKSQYEGSMSLHSALSEDIITNRRGILRSAAMNAQSAISNAGFIIIATV